MPEVHPNLDVDPQETREWLDALSSVVQREGVERARYILKNLLEHAEQQGAALSSSLTTPYINTVSPDRQTSYPGDIELEAKITALLRWNAAAMVLQAGKHAPELGGHIATYASAATIYEVGFHHFFRAGQSDKAGDFLFIQGHASPGIYARAYLEGRLSDEQLSLFRQEVADEQGLSSYPHPWLMPDFWQFPTVSMGLGPLQGIYQARFLKYLQNRGLSNTENRKVWVFCGDGEMDEVESLGAITLAAREKLDNLIFVVNCNLQRLDGPVRGNSKIIQELESLFRGAGWHVVKNIWGSGWDKLLANDTSGLLIKRMNECVDGEYQNYRAKNGAYIREQFFGKYPELLELVKDLSDEDIWKLRRGGHDPIKVHAAYAEAVQHQGQPTVVLMKTVKGFGMGKAGEAQNFTHQQKKMTADDLKHYRDQFQLPLTDEQAESACFYRPPENSPEITYIKQQRQKLGGYLPARHESMESLTIPELSEFSSLLAATGERPISTTMAFVRFLNVLLRHKELGPRIVPIVPDESRTFGMEGLFRQIGIYSPCGQLYTPVDVDQVMPYKESVNGQILQEGINEAGAMASWMAAATSYCNNHYTMLPFYIFYSMFGFQRVGDLAWAAGDMQAKGFLLGATAGRTTLAGEGLQHQDGHSHILAGTIPNCRSYDPTFAYELAVIMQHGLVEMYQHHKNVFYYITVMNENYDHPEMPKDKSVQEHIIKGMYLLKPCKSKKAKVMLQLLGSGTILNEVLKAQTILEQDYQVAAEVWSVTSFNELRREALAVERQQRLNPDIKVPQSHVSQCLNQSNVPVIAATDYMKLYADQIRPFINKPYVVLGTDGFGRSDTREQLRHFFEVDVKSIVYTALNTLYQQGQFKLEALLEARSRLGIDPDKANPVEV